MLEERIKEIVNNLDIDYDRFISDQYDIVYDVCDNILNTDNKDIVLEAPTGTGKSIIALVSSLVLNSYNKKGYIIASDIQLQKQYERDLEKFNLDFGSVRGVDNYNCTLNDLPFSLGKCKQRNYPFKLIQQLDCYSSCQYLQNREYSAKTDTSVLNYSYWLIQMDYVNRKGEGKFKQRDFCFFDEAHKISSIVQNHFAPIIDNNFPEKIEKLVFLINKELKINLSLSVYNQFNHIINEDDNKVLYNVLADLELKLEHILPYAEGIKREINHKYSFDDNISKEDAKIFRLIDWLKDVHCKIEDYVTIIGQSGLGNMVKVKQDLNSYQFKNVDESHLMRKHFHKYANNKIFMSATIGKIETYAKLNSIDNYHYKEISSLFKFDNCSINIFYPIHKMSFREKEQSFLPNVDRVKMVMNYHKNDRGIIHTGSYELTNRLKSILNNDRIISYSNSKEKEVALKQLQESENGILIGPSLLEGIDLKDDLSRFQIFFKVPYMSLADLFVKRKMEVDNEWYQHNTIIHIIQGIGRSIRSTNDYAKTYLIDGCFNSFILNNQFPDYILKRVNIIDETEKEIYKYI